MLPVTLIAITLQIVFGEAVEAVTTCPNTAVGIASMGGLLLAMWSAAGAVLMIHAFGSC